MPYTDEQEREHVHDLLDQIPVARLSAVRQVLEAMAGEAEEITAEDRLAIDAGLRSLEQGRTHTMEDILAELGLTKADLASQQNEPGME